MNGRRRPMIVPERAGVRPVQVEARESAVAPLVARGVVGEDGLPVLLALDLRQQAGAERGDVLDAVQAVVEQHACLEQLEVRGRDHVALAAHVDHRLRAAERQAEVDLDRGGALRDRALGVEARLVGVARDDRVVRIRRGSRPVDVRADAVDARAPQALCLASSRSSPVKDSSH